MTESDNINDAFKATGGDLDLAAVKLGWTRSRLVDRAARYPECRAWLEQRAPTDTEVLAADVVEIPKPIKSDKEMAAVLTKAAADFQIGLAKIGLDQKRADYVMSVQMLARTSFRELVPLACLLVNWHLEVPCYRSEASAVVRSMRSEYALRQPLQ